MSSMAVLLIVSFWSRRLSEERYSPNMHVISDWHKHRCSMCDPLIVAAILCYSVYEQLPVKSLKCSQRQIDRSVHRKRHERTSSGCAVVTEHTPCLKKTVQNCFCHNFVKFPPILIIFGRKMVKRLKVCKVHLFFTSPNLRHHTTVLNANVQNCYKTL